MIRISRIPWYMLFMVTIVGASACKATDGEVPMPTENEVRARFPYHGRLETRIADDVVELRAYQPVEHLRRGGELWAKVGPYVLLFSQETRALFNDFPGVAGVRAITLLPGGQEVARATLARNVLNDLTWRRALNIAGRARVEGTRDPSRLEALVRWGEDRTTYRYNARFVQP